MQRLKYFIAARYVRSPKSHSVINSISGVSIVAMAIPVAAIILLLSIFNGLERMARDMYQAIDADLRITSVEGTTFSLSDFDAEALERVDGIAAYSFSLEQSALAEADDMRTIVQVKGVDEHFLDVLPLDDKVLSGDFSLHVEGEPRLVASHGVMQDLGILRSTAIGESLRLYSINRSRLSSLLPVGGYTRRDVTIAGICSMDEDRRSTLYTSLDVAQDLFNYADRASTVELRVKPTASAEAVAEALQRELGERFEVRTREQSNSIYRLMALEKWGVFFVAVLVMIIASLSIVGTLVMVIIDKREDVVTLRTLGGSRDFVRGIFIAEGRVMALVSLLLGLVLGLGLALLQQHFGFVGIETDTLAVSAYPVEVHLKDVLLTVAAYVAVSHVVVNLTVRALMHDDM